MRGCGMIPRVIFFNVGGGSDRCPIEVHHLYRKTTCLDAPNSMEQCRPAQIARAEMGDVIGEGPILSWSTEDGAGAGSGGCAGGGGGRGSLS